MSVLVVIDGADNYWSMVGERERDSSAGHKVQRALGLLASAPETDPERELRV